MENQLTERISDFTEEEQASLDDFRKNGFPGLKAAIKDPNASLKWFELYMSGKTYTEISKITSTKKDVILRTSEIQQWCKKRNDYYNQLNDAILQKYSQAKLESINTVTTMVSALNKYFGDKFNKFLVHKDKDIIESIDVRLLAQYQKAQESMDKLMGLSVGSNDEKPRKPIVNINMNGGNVKQMDENTIEINAEEDDEKEKAIGEILANLSKIKKVRNSDE